MRNYVKRGGTRGKAEQFWRRLTNHELVGAKSNKGGQARSEVGEVLEQFATELANPDYGEFIVGHAKGSPEDPSLLVIVIQTEAEMDSNAY